MEGLNVNTMVLGTFMLVTQQAAVHLGNDYLDSVFFNQKSVTKNNETIARCDQEVGQRTDRHSRNILIDWQEKSWKRMTGSSVVNSEGLRILRFSIVHEKNS